MVVEAMAVWSSSSPEVGNWAETEELVSGKYQLGAAKAGLRLRGSPQPQ